MKPFINRRSFCRFFFPPGPVRRKLIRIKSCPFCWGWWSPGDIWSASTETYFLFGFRFLPSYWLGVWCFCFASDNTPSVRWGGSPQIKVAESLFCWQTSLLCPKMADLLSLVTNISLSKYLLPPAREIFGQRSLREKKRCWYLWISRPAGPVALCVFIPEALIISISSNLRKE